MGSIRHRRLAIHGTAFLVLTGAVTCSLGSVAFAHAFLKRAMPPVGGTVQTPPTQVSIEFTEGVEPHFSSIVVQDATGAHVDKSDVHAAPDDPKRLIVSLAPLKPGTYTVAWHVVSVDTHKTEGTFQFTVGS